MNENKTNINWYPGHMAKTKKQIIEDIKLIDIVVEILDARCPISSQNPDLKSMIGNKKKIIALNKSDLADEKETIIWKKYFEKEGIATAIVDSNSGKGINEIIRLIEKIMQEDLKNTNTKGRIGKSIRVLVVGIPNVGKSSFINRIAKRDAAKVGNRPGVTTQKQWLKVSNNIELLDTPGILWPKFQNEQIALNLSYTGTIKDEILEKTEIAFYLLKFLLQNYKTNIQERYKLSDDEIKEYIQDLSSENIVEIMNLIGKKRGAVISGGRIDEEKVANILIDDFRKGKIGNISIEKVR